MKRSPRTIKSKSNSNAAKQTPLLAVSLDQIRDELLRTVIQVNPFAAKPVMELFDRIAAKSSKRLTLNQCRSLQSAFLMVFFEDASEALGPPDSSEIYPQMTVDRLREAGLATLKADLAASFERVLLRRSLKNEEKIEILRGMLTTRHLDARLKKFFIANEVKTSDGKPFQGKGFRSMGQEAIYAAAIRLQRIGSPYASHRRPEQCPGGYSGDYVAVMIRDLGLALAMGVEPFDVMAAQMGKPAKPTYGVDLHIGDLECGVLPPAAPITLSVATAIGMGLALAGTGRVVINCNGEGATSSGEWHESINYAAVRELPIVFVVQNNQTALSTPIHEQYKCLSIATKGAGYGIRAITIDGTDPEAVFAAVTEAADACRRGDGPVMIELVCMRMCGHAHHDDMLYFGYEPDQFLRYPDNKEAGYVDQKAYKYWSAKDPISGYSRKLIAEGILSSVEIESLVNEIEIEMEAAAKKVTLADWPDPKLVEEPVFSDGERITHLEPLENRSYPFPTFPAWQSKEAVGFVPDAGGKTFWQAIVEALAEEMRRDPNVYILGEDVGGKYGNAFVILKPLLAEFGDRLLNMPLSEAAIIGAATGSALLGKRPIAEIQFNDFVASGFNQLVNNTAKIFSRWGHPVPLTVRMPWGGLRNAGPYHSQNTEAWFYRTPGLKIVCPSTPREAKALLKASIRDDNPVLYYEHIALYRAADIKEQTASAEEDFILPIGKAHLKKDGKDITIITYGAYVHRCLSVAEELEKEDRISCQVLDLRSLQPLDKSAILSCVQTTGRVLIVHEDSKTGGVGQSVAAIVGEEAFEYLDAPIRTLGALDKPVPYSPTLEEAFLVSRARIRQAAALLAAY